MGLDFLRQYNGTRVLAYGEQPEPLPPDPDGKGPTIELEYEDPLEKWAARHWPDSAGRPDDWLDAPRRFVDGKAVGETIALLKAPSGTLVPVRLAQIGSTVMEVNNRQVRRAFQWVEQVVALRTDLFPWAGIEGFASALQAAGLRLLPVTPPQGATPGEYEALRRATEARTYDEMTALEAHALAQDPTISTVVDGRLEPRDAGFTAASDPVVGVIKTHHQIYLHQRGLGVLYEMEPGQRTPVFAINGLLPVISWYVRFAGGMPNYGAVRVEVARARFEGPLGGDFDYVNRLSALLYAYRCQTASYSRAAISLQPIVRAEESLGSLFSPLRLLTRRFYSLTAI